MLEINAERLTKHLPICFVGKGPDFQTQWRSAINCVTLKEGRIKATKRNRVDQSRNNVAAAVPSRDRAKVERVVAPPP